MAAICAFGGLIFYFGERALLPEVFKNAEWYLVILRAVSLVAVSILIAYAAMRVVPLRPSRLGLRQPSLDTLLWGIACAAATLVGGALSMAILFALDLSPVGSSFEVLLERTPPLIAGYAGAIALSEELLFRGTMFALFMVLFQSRWIAAGLALVLFLLADVHAMTLAELILILPPSLVLTGFFLWKRDLAICLLGHGGARLIGMFIAEMATRLH